MGPTTIVVIGSSIILPIVRFGLRFFVACKGDSVGFCVDITCRR